MPISLHFCPLVDLYTNQEPPISANQPKTNKHTNKQAKRQTNLPQTNQLIKATTLDHVSINADLTWVNTW